MKVRNTAWALVAALALTGCDTWETSSLPQDVKANPAPATIAPSDIQVTEGNLAGQQFERLGDLKVTVNKTTAFHPAPTREAVIAKLQKDASKLGANAVIDARISEVQISAVSWGTRTGTGQAVRLAQ